MGTSYRVGRALTAVAVLLITVGQSTGEALAAPAARQMPIASSAGGIRTIGPLFFHGITRAHGCTASVVHSRPHNVIVTAAHCINGTGHGVLFAPGSVGGRSPNGVWVVDNVWVNPAWIRDQDPRRDYAFLQVASQRRGGRTANVEDVTGAPSLGITAHHRPEVRVSGYPAGLDDAPITCRNTIFRTAGYPTFDCHGYRGGTSGSPFVAIGRGGRPWVVGLIGGLHQGGCHEWTSYSSPLDREALLDLRRAASGRDPDSVPRAGGDGC